MVLGTYVLDKDLDPWNFLECRWTLWGTTSRLLCFGTLARLYVFSTPPPPFLSPADRLARIPGTLVRRIRKDGGCNAQVPLHRLQTQGCQVESALARGTLEGSRGREQRCICVSRKTKRANEPPVCSMQQRTPRRMAGGLSKPIVLRLNDDQAMAGPLLSG